MSSKVRGEIFGVPSVTWERKRDFEVWELNLHEFPKVFPWEADVELAEEREIAEMDVQLLQTKALLQSIWVIQGHGLIMIVTNWTGVFPGARS